MRRQAALFLTFLFLLSLTLAACGQNPTDSPPAEETLLVDGESGDERWPLSSRTNGGRLVHLAGDRKYIGQFIDVKITDSNTWALFGEVEEPASAPETAGQ